MTLHTYTPKPMSIPGMNFPHLMISEIQPAQTFSRCLPTHPDTMGDNNTQGKNFSADKHKVTLMKKWVKVIKTAEIYTLECK